MADAGASCAEHGLRGVVDRVGEVLAHRFVLMKLIGIGSRNTTVWEARDTELAQDVAVKICPPVDPLELERTIHGTWVGSRLAHPGVTRVIEFGETDDGAYYCVMERLRGRTVQRVLETQPLRPADAARVVERTLEALEYVHAQGVIHRDIKTTNLFVGALGEGRFTVKLLDFGIARLVTDVQPGDLDPSKIVGTPEYMAPEQITGGELDARSDLYAVGVVLFRLLTGQLPFEEETRQALYLAHLEKAPPALGSVDPTLPVELDAVVRRALAKAPEDRFASAAEMRAALRGIRRALWPADGRPVTRRLAYPIEDLQAG
ncbi:MAG: serine/threonine protein kinase [Myxococcales bacterium]|nr:serine/threonine protein kinase [Myxococcales bacterium]MCB9734442.1 serine/threonine protein kinase [Deltaproteobacteria bacterium]